MGGQQSYLKGVALVVLAATGWSLSGVFVRFLPGLTGWQINCWRGYWMAVVLLVYLVARYRGAVWDQFRLMPPMGLAAVAAFFALGSTLYVTSLTLASTANVACLTAVAPIFTAMLSRIATGEQPSLATWAAAGVAFLGAAVVVWNGVQAGNAVGNGVAILVAFCFASQTVSLRRYRNFDMVPAICVGGFATFLIAGLVGGGFSTPPAAIPILALMGVVQLGLPLVLFARGAGSVPAVTMSLIVLLDVILNPLWSWIGVGETPTLAHAFGGAIIVGAVAASIVFGRRSVAAPKAEAAQVFPRP